MADSNAAKVVVDLIADTLTAVAAGRFTDDPLCQHLGRALAADAGVSLHLPPDEPPMVCAAYPDEQAAMALAEFSMRRASQAMDHYNEFVLPEFGHMVMVSITPPPVYEGHRGYARLLAFAKRQPFPSGYRDLLELTCRPMAALWPVATVAYNNDLDHATVSQDSAVNLSTREREVLTLLADGLLATSIAARLSLSPRTVHKHLGNIYRKLGVHDRLVAVSLARKQGLIDRR